jgi:hypothetical protein
VVRSETGVAEYHLMNDIRCYPNPSRGLFYVESSDPFTSADLQIFNQLGQCLYSLRLHWEEGSTQLIDLQHFPSGIYWMVFTEKKTIFAEKIIILR